MNFLAHLWIAERTATSMAGAVLGDVVRGTDLSAFPSDIAEGIRLHRRIDALTDRHPIVSRHRERFERGSRRYAGILIDMACDHALATHWTQHSREPLAAFCLRSAAVVAGAAPWFSLAGARPPETEEFAALLQSYADPRGIDRALTRIAARARQPLAVLAATAHWQHSSEALAPMLPALLNELLVAVGN